MKRGFENFEGTGRDGAEMKRPRSGNKFEVRLLIPSRTAGSVIGKAGTNIKELRHKNNANVRIPDNMGPERIMWIQTDTTETAINVIEQSLPYMLDDGIESKSRESQFAASKSLEIRLLIHESIVGGIIGRGGSTINQIEKESGAKVHAFSTCAPQSSDRCVTIKGTTEEIVSALNPILSFLETRSINGYHEMFDPNNFDCFYANEYGGYGVPSDAIGVNQMPPFQRSNNMPFGGSMYGGANAFLPNSNMEPVGFGDTMNSFGSPNFPKEEPIGLGKGMNSFLSTMAMKNEPEGPIQTSKVTVPKEMGGAIIGQGGQRIRKVRMDSRAEINVAEPEEGSADRIITITGTPQQIQSAQYLLQQCIRTYGQSSVGGRF